MELANFIDSLITEGSVTVIGQLGNFTEADLEETSNLLKTYYHEDLLEMPFTAPGFAEEAALWAAQYFYQAVQLTVLRDAGEDIIREQLKHYAGIITSEFVYSADLVLRYLPDLFELAKGLAPSDTLVEELRKLAAAYPFSSVGIELNTTISDDLIFTNPSLKQVYTDRIIEKKDKRRSSGIKIREAILETTGNYTSVLWPQWDK